MPAAAELFAQSPDDPDDSETESILARIRPSLVMSWSIRDNEQYLQERRKLIGPVADIMHPEFGLRENKDDETYKITYRIHTRIATPSNPDESIRDCEIITIEEQVFDYNGQPVVTLKPDATDSPSEQYA